MQLTKLEMLGITPSDVAELLGPEFARANYLTLLEPLPVAYTWEQYYRRDAYYVVVHLASCPEVPSGASHHLSNHVSECLDEHEWAGCCGPFVADRLFTLQSRLGSTFGALSALVRLQGWELQAMDPSSSWAGRRSALRGYFQDLTTVFGALGAKVLSPRHVDASLPRWKEFAAKVLAEPTLLDQVIPSVREATRAGFGRRALAASRAADPVEVVFAVQPSNFALLAIALAAPRAWSKRYHCGQLPRELAAMVAEYGSALAVLDTSLTAPEAAFFLQLLEDSDDAVFKGSSNARNLGLTRLSMGAKAALVG